MQKQSEELNSVLEILACGYIYSMFHKTFFFLFLHLTSVALAEEAGCYRVEKSF